MTTMREHFQKLGNMGDKVIGYAIIGSMINIMSEAADELEDQEIIYAFEKLTEIITQKQKSIMEMDIY